MSRTYSRSQTRSLSVILGGFALSLLISNSNYYSTLAWLYSTRHTMLSMKSGTPWFRGVNDCQGNIATTIRTIRSPSELFLESTESATASLETSKGNHPLPQIDATLVGDYMVQMKASSALNAQTIVTWSLYPIKDVVGVLTSKTTNQWTDGTEATEALHYGITTDSIYGLNPDITIEASTGSDWIVSRITQNKVYDQDLISLLRILQAQWVAGQIPTNLADIGGPSLVSEAEVESKIAIHALSSEAGMARLFQEAGLADASISNAEWVEMMTGDSRIVGRLPRSLVHRFNILHRGIGAFVTKDRPIDFTDLSSVRDFPELYVHRRAADKRIFPSLYDMWVGGVSLAGENPELTAQREIAEELGLSGALTTPLSENGRPFMTCLVCTAYNRCLVDLFQYTMDTSSEEVTWQKEEVAWGDFVDYRVIMASADLSIRRAASEGSWPGSYPPVQSDYKGVLPEDMKESPSHDGDWKEWDYVPDGLLVWEAWLDFLEQQKRPNQRAPKEQILSFEMEFGLEDGQTELVRVELGSMEDIVPKSLELSARFNIDINEIQSMLKKLWTDVTFVPIYTGSSVPNQTNNPECTIELPSGLVLELRPSTIGENAGLGLFVRKVSSDIPDVLQSQGSAFCAYGPLEKIVNSLEGTTEYQRQRSFEFMLSDGFDSYVWYKGTLLTVWDVLQSTGATGVKSHRLEEATDEDDTSSRAGLRLLHDSDNPCYLIPPVERPEPRSLTIRTIGHMCNDLAGGKRGQTEEEYDAASDEKNLLVLVPNVDVNDGILEPKGMPVLTLSKTVNIANVNESIEVGLRYGLSYWKSTASSN